MGVVIASGVTCAWYTNAELRFATADGGLVEADAAVVVEEEDDECEDCAGLDGLPCFECYMAERGFDV